MGIDQVTRDMDRVHLRLVNLARRVADGHTTIEDANQLVEYMTQQMSAESRQAILEFWSTLTQNVKMRKTTEPDFRKSDVYAQKIISDRACHCQKCPEHETCTAATHSDPIEQLLTDARAASKGAMLSDLHDFLEYFQSKKTGET